MKLNIKYNLKVYTAEGKLKRVVQTPGHSFVRGFLEILFAQMSNTTFAVRDTGGIYQDVVGPDADILDITASGNAKGLVVGTDNTAVAISDFRMSSISGVGTGTNQFTHGAQTYVDPTVTGETAQFSILRSFTNGSGSAIFVAEVGLLGDGSNVSHDFLLVREVLALTLEVEDSETLDVTAVIQIASGTDGVSVSSDMFIKTADETVNGSSTLQDDDHLSFSVAADELIMVECHFVWDTDTTPNIKFGLTVPAGCTVQWGDSSGFGLPKTESQTIVTNSTFETTDLSNHFTYIIKVGSTAGTFQLQWAQGTSNASNTVLKEGSYMLVHRI